MRTEAGRADRAAVLLDWRHLSGCSLELGLQIIGGRWTLAIALRLLGGTMRFGELRSTLQPISANVLSQRLLALIDDGIVLAVDAAEGGGYRLTPWGMELDRVKRAIDDWIAARRPHVSGVCEPRSPLESGVTELTSERDRDVQGQDVRACSD